PHPPQLTLLPYTTLFRSETLLSIDEPLGHDYWHLMNLAGEYAYAGREWVARKVVSILGGREMELVHNHHNFAWTEKHDGEIHEIDRKSTRLNSSHVEISY